MSGTSSPRVIVRQDPGDPDRYFFDFDPAAPGGRGGAGVRVDPDSGFVSIDGIHKNTNMPPRSTGGLLAEGFHLAGVPAPSILEAYNVEASTAKSLSSGNDGRGTLIGNLLSDAALELGASVGRWEPVRDVNIWHLRVHLSYP